MAYSSKDRYNIRIPGAPEHEAERRLSQVKHKGMDSLKKSQGQRHRNYILRRKLQRILVKTVNEGNIYRESDSVYVLGRQ